MKFSNNLTDEEIIKVCDSGNRSRRNSSRKYDSEGFLKHLTENKEEVRETIKDTLKSRGINFK